MTDHRTGFPADLARAGLEGALSPALLELVRHDATTLCWYNRTRAPGLGLDSARATTRANRAARRARRGATVHIDSGAQFLDHSIPLWSFREDVAIESTEAGLNILTRWNEVRLQRPPAAIEDSLHRMTLGPVALTNVTDLDWADLHDVFRRVPGCVVRSLGLRNSATPLLSATPVTQRARFELPKLDGTQAIRLSRFAFLRDNAGEMMLESPLSHHRVALHRPLASWLVAALG